MMEGRKAIFPLKKCSVNMQLLPIKIHYFFYFSALAGVLPFRPIFAKQLGISATAVGVAFTVLPFVKFVANPLFGAAVDYFKKLKVVLLFLVSLIATSHLLLLTIPPYVPYKQHNESSLSIRLQCTEESTTGHFADSYNVSCIQRKISNDSLLCSGQCPACVSPVLGYNTKESSDKRTFKSSDYALDGCSQRTSNFSSQLGFLSSESTFPFILRNITSEGGEWCPYPIDRVCNITCGPEFKLCFQDESVSEKDIPSYMKMQFWLFLLFFLVSSVSLATATSLSDTACYELLGTRLDKYGAQRMWGALGWGSGAFLSGYLNNLFTDESGTNYSPGFCMMALFMCMDVVAISKMNVKSTKYSKNIVKDVGALFFKFRVIVFVLCAFSVGILSGVLWNYQFWYLQELGASQLLLGLVIFVECFFAELPCFMIAGKVIKKIGHVQAMTVAFVAYGFRYMGYAFLKNPWLALPLGLLYGPTFGIFYAAMTSYAKNVAPPGTEATMQTILGVSFEGVGVAVGTFLGGCGFDYFGSRNTFLASGILSFLLMILTAVIQFFVLRHKPEFRPANRPVTPEPVAV